MIQTIRQSSLSTWEKCQEMFRRRYLEGEIIPPGLAAHVGTGVHRAAEVNHRAKVVTGRDEPLGVICDAARDGYVHAIKDGGAFIPPEDLPSAKSMAAAGIDEAVSLARLYREEVAPAITPKLVECRIEFSVPDLVPSISGTVDLVDAAGRLIDIKTAAKAWPAARAEQSPQATIYHKLVEILTGAAPTEIRFDVLVKGARPRYQPLSTSRSEADFLALVSRLQIMMRMIVAGIFPPAPTGAWVCAPRYCGYFYSCPHVPAHKKLLPKRSS